MNSIFKEDIFFVEKICTCMYTSSVQQRKLLPIQRATKCFPKIVVVYLCQDFYSIFIYGRFQMLEIQLIFRFRYLLDFLKRFFFFSLLRLAHFAHPLEFPILFLLHGIAVVWKMNKIYLEKIRIKILYFQNSWWNFSLKSCNKNGV